MTQHDNTVDAAVLEKLFALIKGRKGQDPETSYTAKLFGEGREKIASKVMEEAAETVEAALKETPERLTSESADVLYHLLVLWADVGIEPADVWVELARRQGISGIEEKNSRPQS